MGTVDLMEELEKMSVEQIEAEAKRICREAEELVMSFEPVLPLDPVSRKRIPLCRGCFDYFPAALMAVAELSQIGNEQHNPGEPMHHARGKSSDHGDCILRHQMDRGLLDTDGVRHSTKVAWRALAQLQEELERAGLAPLARGAKE